MAQTINVDMTPGLFMPTLHYSQGDVGREFVINLATRDGMTIPAGATVTMQATKPSGFGFSVAGSLSGTVATFTSTAEMTDESGRFQAEIVIAQGTTVIGTTNFWLEGEKNPHPEGTIDGQEGTIIPELTLLVERVEKAASDILDMTVEAETLAAGSQATYSYDEDTNTATFGIPQGEAGAGAAGVVASAYSSSKTYAVGDYVIHNSNLYRCTTAITTAESFTAAHWTQVVLGDDVSDLKADLIGQLGLDDVNLFNSYNKINAYITGGGKIVSNASNRVAWLMLMPNTKYRFKMTKKANTDVFIALYNTQPANDVVGNLIVSFNASATSAICTFETTDTYVYLAFKYWSTSATTFTEEEVLGSISIEIAESFLDKIDNLHLFSNEVYPKYSEGLFGVDTSSSSVDISNGVPVISNSAANYNTYFIECNEGDVFFINGQGGSLFRLWAFIESYELSDSSATIISKAGSNAISNNEYVVAPKDAKYAIFNIGVADGSGVAKFSEVGKKYINNGIGEAIHVNWLYDAGKKAISKANGTAITVTQSVVASDFVDVSAYNKINVLCIQRNATNSSIASIAYYDAEQNFVFAEQYLNAVADTTIKCEIVIPNDIKYIRLTFYNDTSSFYCFGEKALAEHSAKETEGEYISVGGWVISKAISSTTGDIFTSVTTLMASDYVDVSGYNTLEFSAMARINSSNTAAVSFYDDQKVWISSRKYVGYPADEIVNAKVELPNGTKYVRFTYFTSDSYIAFYCYGHNEEKPQMPHIRFMVFGNSYGCDSIAYVPFILKNMGITSEIYLYVRDGCSLRDIYNRWESDDPRDIESDGSHAGSYQRNVFKVDTRYMDKWIMINRESMKDICSLGDWDFVTLQQYSGYSVDADTYAPWAELDIALINEVVERGTPIVYTHVWTRHAVDNIPASLETFEAVAEKYPFDWCIPCGTAIFNARANDTIAQLGDSEYHNLWCDDNIHLQDGLPCYIAACTVVESICRRFFPERSCLFDKTAITTDWGIPEYNGPIIGMTDENRLLAQKTAIMACNHPFVVTPATFTPYEEYTSLSDFPSSGTKGILYKALDTGYTYTWDGSQYVYNEALPYTS